MDGGCGGGRAELACKRRSRTPEEVFHDFRARRAGMIKALTTEAEQFYQLCDPGRQNLCLYGLPDESWEVNLPADEIPTELPEPPVGINFARDGMNRRDWLSLVAVHSDSWLLAVAFYLGAQLNFDKEDRSRLFSLINNLPSLFEVVVAFAEEQAKRKIPNSSSKSSKPSSRKSHAEPRASKPSMKKLPMDDNEGFEDEVEDEDERDSTPCGACGSSTGADEFWICCDLCEQWYHGKCVRITPARAEHIKHYKCPDCSNSNKRARA